MRNKESRSFHQFDRRIDNLIARKSASYGLFRPLRLVAYDLFYFNNKVVRWNQFNIRLRLKKVRIVEKQFLHRSDSAVYNSASRACRIRCSGKAIPRRGER